MKRILLLFPLIFCLSSCWDYHEPSAQNYVMGLGIDYENDKFLLSIETVKITGEPTSLSSSEGVILESEGETLFDALQEAEAKAGKKLYWGHIELVLMGESVAKYHLYDICDLISRSSEIYSNVNLSVAQGVSAKKILNSKTPQGGMVSTHVINIFENEENSQRFISCELWELQRCFTYTLIPVIHLVDYPVADGSAVIKNKSLVGYLTGEETQCFSLLELEVSGAKLPDVVVDNITLSTQVLDVKKKTDELNLSIVLLSSSEPFDTVNPENRKRLEDKISSLILSQINSITTKPFGNPLSNDSYNINVTLENSGLVKR